MPKRCCCRGAEQACLGWLGSSCGSASPGVTHRAHPKAHRQGPPAQQPVLTGSSFAVWLLARAVKREERPVLHESPQGVWLEGRGTGTPSSTGTAAGLVDGTSLSSSEEGP